MLGSPEIHPEARRVLARPATEWGQNLIPECGADRGLKARADLQCRQDRRAVLAILWLCDQPPQALRFRRGPGQLGLDLTRPIERRLLGGEPICNFGLGRLDSGARMLDPSLSVGDLCPGSSQRLR